MFFFTHEHEQKTRPLFTEVIGSSAFSHCESLESVVIPEGVTRIDNWTFYGCSSLASVVIPEGVEVIGSSAFEGCSSLGDVYFRGTEAQWGALGVQLSASARVHFGPA